jgi:transposase
MDMIPDEMLDFLSVQTKVDYKVHKLTGAVIFKLLIYSLLTNRQSSLRVLESVFNSYKFKAAVGLNNEDNTRFNSIRDRIATIRSDYFKNLFDFCSERFSKQLKNANGHILRYDSTMVAISAQLLDIGFKAGEKTTKKQIKFSIGFDGMLPRSAKLFSGKEHASEERTLAELVLEVTHAPTDIVVFDRGVQKRESFCKISSKAISFVGRLKVGARIELISQNPIPEVKEQLNYSVIVEEDSNIYLFDKEKVTKHTFRLIKARIVSSGDPIWFVTNIIDLDAYQIADIYKKRWDIEVFFKFLKQELNLDHILVRTVNGLEVTLYATLIAAMLLTAYKELNNLKGYKILKIKFVLELEEELLKEIITLCGGDPNKMKRPP